MSDTDPTAVTSGLFVLLETTAEQDKDLPDPEVDAFLEAAESEMGTDGLLLGWAIVAAILRKHLIDHAEKVGCDCGSPSGSLGSSSTSPASRTHDVATKGVAMADLATQDAPFGLNQVTFTPGERVADRLFEGEEAVLHVMGWVGRPRPRGRFVDNRAKGGQTLINEAEHLPARFRQSRLRLRVVR